MAVVHASKVNLLPYPYSSSGCKAKNYHWDHLCPHNKMVLLYIIPQLTAPNNNSVNFYFEIPDLKKSCKDSTKRSCIPVTQLPLLIVYIYNHSIYIYTIVYIYNHPN